MIKHCSCAVAVVCNCWGNCKYSLGPPSQVIWEYLDDGGLWQACPEEDSFKIEAHFFEGSQQFHLSDYHYHLNNMTRSQPFTKNSQRIKRTQFIQERRDGEGGGRGGREGREGGGRQGERGEGGRDRWGGRDGEGGGRGGREREEGGGGEGGMVRGREVEGGMVRGRKGREVEGGREIGR